MPSEIDLITPGHFLVGSHLLQCDPAQANPVALAERLEFQHQIIGNFWRWWRRDYLRHLQNRQKWRDETTNLQPGDVVVVREDITPTYQWPLALVVEVHPDSKGDVRVVTIRMKGSTFRRTIRNLVKLPVCTSHEECNLL